MNGEVQQNAGPIEVCAAALCHNGKLLALRRSADQAMGGYWELPGGKREAGESNAQCLQRELYEELSICIEPGVELGCHCYAYPDKTVSLSVFMVTHWSGDLTLSVHDEQLWLAPDQFDQIEWAPADVAHLAAIKRRLR